MGDGPILPYPAQAQEKCLEHRRKDGGFLGQPAWLWSLAALLAGLALSLLAASRGTLLAPKRGGKATKLG